MERCFCDIFSFRMPVTTIGIVIIFRAPQDLHFPTIASWDGGYLCWLGWRPNIHRWDCGIWPCDVRANGDDLTGTSGPCYFRCFLHVSCFRDSGSSWISAHAKKLLLIKRCKFDWRQHLGHLKGDTNVTTTVILSSMMMSWKHLDGLCKLDDFRWFPRREKRYSKHGKVVGVLFVCSFWLRERADDSIHLDCERLMFNSSHVSLW